jgi:hypothetical protein
MIRDKVFIAEFTFSLFTATKAQSDYGIHPAFV